MPTALITGITGQDGSYLADLLLAKKYQVVGIVSSKHNIGFQNINHIKSKLILTSGDLLDEKSLHEVIKKYQPQEIYNLAGVTFIPLSWQEPILTMQANLMGVLSILEGIRRWCPKAKFFQATSAKIFGDAKTYPQDENTPIQPLSPYAVSKAAAHHLVQNYRNQYGAFSCSGIMYNHESERRGPEFVTRKITQASVKIKLGKINKLLLGDIEAKQDWGYAPDYVQAMWLMLQQVKADDFIIASGELHTVKEVCEVAFSYLNLEWSKFVAYDKNLVRKEHYGQFVGNAKKAKEILGWQPKVSFKQMIQRMVDYDMQLAKEQAI